MDSTMGDQLLLPGNCQSPQNYFLGVLWCHLTINYMFLSLYSQISRKFQCLKLWMHFMPFVNSHKNKGQNIILK